MSGRVIPLIWVITIVTLQVGCVGGSGLVPCPSYGGCEGFNVLRPEFWSFSGLSTGLQDLGFGV